MPGMSECSSTRSPVMAGITVEKLRNQTEEDLRESLGMIKQVSTMSTVLNNLTGPGGEPGSKPN